MTRTTYWPCRQSFYGVALSVLTMILSGCATTLPLIYSSAIELNPTQRASFSEYEQKPLQKAFAVSPDGLSGNGWLGEEANRAVRSALSNCQRAAVKPCRVFDISGVPYQSAYIKFSTDSRNALATMKVPRDIPYHLEAMDWGIKGTTSPEGTDGYQGPTPLSFPNINSISTAALADRIKSGTITVVDSRGISDEDLPTIPNAYLVDWAGTLDGPSREPALRQNFAKVMQLLVPDRAMPVAIFCWSAQCWVSAHAALRLQALGYTNIFWYRGGIEAWKAANLPVVTAVPHATIWSQ